MKHQRRVFRALALLIAAVPLAATGNQALGLAPGQQLIIAAAHASGISVLGAPPPGKGGDDEEEEQEAPADQATAPDAPRAPMRSNETKQLERAITDLGDLTGLDQDAIDELERQFDDEVAELEAELDDIELDLDEYDAELDLLGDKRGVDGSPQLRRAEDKLMELQDGARELQRQLADIKRRATVGGDPAPLLAAARALNGGIAAIHEGERELISLIEAAEKRERGGGPPEGKGEGKDEGGSSEEE